MGRFDDRAWRTLDLPHDWCVELPFDARGGHSHGYKAIGRAFPENSVGWYRRRFFVPESDLGRRVSIEFDGVHRDSIVWVNGFYAGTEPSGYTSFSYDISDHLDYGGDNVVAVRVDATLEEGWYYNITREKLSQSRRFLTAEHAEGAEFFKFFSAFSALSAVKEFWLRQSWQSACTRDSH
ncbi:MAG: beta galactosidase jelly roll domain-containing protein [Thermoflexales bacterium]|nr:beta galactosidase jelly roll domain-containing protein [Thermoflexales bacterium]